MKLNVNSFFPGEGPPKFVFLDGRGENGKKNLFLKILLHRRRKKFGGKNWKKVNLFG